MTRVCLLPGEQQEGSPMTRCRSLTSQLYRAARTSNNARAARKGPVAFAERLARRKTYAKSMGATGKLLRFFGLK